MTLLADMTPAWSYPRMDDIVDSEFQYRYFDPIVLPPNNILG